ncbi:hypothetical protein G6F42_022331 [Rhizopus arrhizus]|nr:hypothetical protein G6F42_022331 [Rhizopus arrhizus]
MAVYIPTLCTLDESKRRLEQTIISRCNTNKRQEISTEKRPNYASHGSSGSDEKRKRYSYPSRYYHRKSDESIPQHKRMRTSPPTSPAPTYKPDTWRKNSSRSHSKSDHKSSTKVAKQNPKIKQNALHTYITYMIYNDLAHGGGTNQTGKTNAMVSPILTSGAIEKSHQTNVFESANNNISNSSSSMPPSTSSSSSSSVSPNYYKQTKQRNDHLHHRPYAGDALHNSPGSSSSMRSVSTTPADAAALTVIPRRRLAAYHLHGIRPPIIRR